MKRPFVRVALAVLLCLITLSPTAWGRDWRRAPIRRGHPNGTIQMTSVTVGNFLFLSFQQPILGFRIVSISRVSPNVTDPESRHISITQAAQLNGR